MRSPRMRGLVMMLNLGLTKQTAPCALCWRAPWAAVASLGALGPGPDAPPACGAWWAAWVHPFVRIGTALFVWSCVVFALCLHD